MAAFQRRLGDPLKRRKRIVTEISVETTESIYVLRRGVSRAWCSACGMPTEMTEIEPAAEKAGISPRTVYRWIEAGDVHFREEEEIVLVCGRSLSIFLQQRQAGKENHC